MAQQKKWVFSELVKDANDPMQLIAYAMYKADKDDHANQCRARRLRELKIVAELESYHDGIAHSQRKLDDYRDKARRTIDELIESVNEGVARYYTEKINALTIEHEKEKAELESNYQKKIQQIWHEWTTQAEQFAAHLKVKPWYVRYPTAFVKWAVSGIPGLLATVFTTILIVGVVSLFSTDSIETTRKALFTGIDMLLPGEHGISLPPLSAPKEEVKKTSQ